MVAVSVHTLRLDLRGLVVAALLIGACKNSAPPLATAAAVVDMAPAPLACAAIQGCIGHCRADDHACQAACIARLTSTARPFFDRLQACVAPACADGDGGAAPCRDPSSFACQLCAMSHCAQVGSACLAH